MAHATPRPRVSRETRRLLAVATIALLTLWALARLRQPDAPLPTNPMPPLLAQLAPPAGLSDIAAELAGARDRLQDSLMRVTLRDQGAPAPRLALHWSPGVAMTVVARALPMSPAAAGEALAYDSPTGLTLVATGRVEAPARLREWQPPTEQATRFVVAASSSAGGLSVQPAFISRWLARPSAAWNGSIWLIDTTSPLAPGTFLFTPAGEFIGVTTADMDELAVVPAAALYTRAETVSTRAQGAGTGWLGLQVTSLTSSLAAATGVKEGVLVTEVALSSPAKDAITAGDVVTRVNETPISSVDQWATLVDRMGPGESVRLQIQTATGVRDLAVATQVAPHVKPMALGLDLRRSDGVTRVVGVDRASASYAAGIRVGDVVVRAGADLNPTPAQVQRAYAEGSRGFVLLLFSRDGVTHAAALERP
jgi:hypothetical protein